MRVLMLGWDFSPRLSGGVGSACQGLANALARAAEPLATEVLFVLPRTLGDEEPERVRLLVEADATRAPEVERTAPRRVEAVRTSAVRAHVLAAQAKEAAVAELEGPPPPPTLPPPSEALRLLTIDSPLRPYLSPEDYGELVHALLERVRRAPPAPAPVVVRSVVPRAEPVVDEPELGREPEEVAAPNAASNPVPALAADVRVPPYGRTLLAEVERYARAVLALAQRQSFDVIHAHDWMTFPAALLLQERTGKPLIVHFHSCEAERRGPLAKADVRAIEQAALDAAERVLCVSEASARTLRAHYAVQFAKLRVVHNAYAPLASAGPARKKDAQAPVVLYVGRLSEQKAPDVFLRAAAKVLARHPRARFVLAGDGELYPELKALARELELGRALRFTGFIDGSELAETYADADVYVLSSAAEPFGISALEALSLGVPSIVPRTAGVTEVVRSVLRFEPGDVEGLADKIVALLERPALRGELARAGLREVKKIRWDRPARALRAIYDELAGPPS
ncbi:MAG: glycosyltransferase family 1 protein [Planctomycetes bacterium]|nr:glycosyltransferase family 1 protein [Planctomycetota bacterium]